VIKIYISTIFWGDFHSNAFIDFNLPTLLAPGNLPYMCSAAEIVYTIKAPSADLERLRQTPAFSALNDCVELRLIPLQETTYLDKIQAHNKFWGECLQTAKCADTDAPTYALFMPPDVVWSDNSFRYAFDLLKKGVKAIFLGMPRVASETFLSAFKAKHIEKASESIQVSGRDLVDLAFSHSHPLWFTYFRNSKNFPIHPEFILWPIKDEGFLARYLCREMFFFAAQNVGPNSTNLLKDMDNPADIHIVQDSDDMCALSLASLTQDTAWYKAKNTLDPVDIGRWWLSYESPMNDMLANTNIRFHSKTIAPSQWQQIEHQADCIVHSLLAAREIQRVLIFLRNNKCYRAAELIATALQTARLAERMPIRTPASICIPDRNQLQNWLSANTLNIQESQFTYFLRKKILGHITLDNLTLSGIEPRKVSMLNGTTRILSCDGDDVYLDEISITTAPIQVGPNRLFFVDAVL
jgi:hypothetical protein